jgi:tetratricopeptide (TPR) repeat protein
MSHHLVWKLLGIAGRLAKEEYFPSRSGSIFDRKNSSDYFTRGDAKAEKGDHAGAIKDYDHAIAMDPDRLYYFIHRGIAKAILGDINGAKEDYLSAAWLDPVEFKRRSAKGLPGFDAPNLNIAECNSQSVD